jgi:hypothetical protein
MEYGGPNLPYALSRDNCLQRKKRLRNSAVSHAIMSLCSRGAVFRNPRLNLLRLIPRSIPRSQAQALFSQSRAAPQSKVHADLRTQCRCFSTTRFQQEQPPAEPQSDSIADSLPVCCPGCGAFSQTVEANEPGYYGTSRKQIRKLLAARKEAIEAQNIEQTEAVPTEGDDLSAQQNDAIKEAAPPKPIQGRTSKLSLKRTVC